MSPSDLFNSFYSTFVSRYDITINEIKAMTVLFSNEVKIGCFMGIRVSFGVTRVP